MKNYTTKKVTKLTAKLLIAVLTVCLAVAVIPAFTDVFVPTAAAADSISASDTATLNTDLANYASSNPGGTVNVTMTADMAVGVGTTVTIPAGITVNLYMNGKTIAYADTEWQISYVCAITNNGTLNIYSGSRTSPTHTSGSTISLNNTRTGMNASGEDEEAYSFLEGIHNNGTLYVGKNVNITVSTTLEYDSRTGYRNASASTGATCIQNQNKNCKCVVESANLTAYARSRGFHSPSRRCHSRAYVYGIYSGDVTVNGTTAINVNGSSYLSSDVVLDSNNTCQQNVVTYGICSDGPVTMNGGSITYNTDITLGGSYNATEEGANRVYFGGILTTSGVVPVITDGTLNQPTSDNVLPNHGDQVYSEVNVGSTSELPLSGVGYRDKVAGDARSENDKPTATINAGSFKDELGNSYAGQVVNEDEAGWHPTPIIRGAFEGTYRVHIVYRYWVDAQKSALDTTVIGSTGLEGYSYLPLNDGTDIVSSVISLDGLTDSAKLTRTSTSGISVVSGGAVYNSSYWSPLNVAWASPNGQLSDIDIASVKGTSFYTFSNSTGSTVGEGTAAPIYIFVDYVKQSAKNLNCKAGSADAATVTYTGEEIKGSDIGLKFTAGSATNVVTGQYDIDCDDASKIYVEYSYWGTNLGGTEEGTEENKISGLPTNAGTYTVNVKVAGQEGYVDDQGNAKKDATLYKNRKSLDYSFTLTVEKAKTVRGNLPQNVSVVYGKKLSAGLTFGTYAATGIGNETDTAIDGAFSFTTASDGTAYKNVGTGTVQVTWTPASSVYNYDVTTFAVNYTVTKAALTIQPNAATVTYGETEFTTAYSVNLIGLAGNDEGNESTIAAITNALSFMIDKDGAWVAYTPDQVGAGTYPIRATFEGTLPTVMANYSYTYVFGTEANPYGNLTVEKRNLKVKATAVSREYSPTNNKVNVTFTIEEGKYGVDDVSVATIQGSIANINVGTRIVNGIDKSKVQTNLSGGAAANYVVSEVIYETGSDLTVAITKATPVVATPTADDRYYQMGATLADVAIITSDTSVAGAWQWVDGNINPTVAVKTYQAKFVPEDTTNYNEKIVDVSLNVKVTPVTITYTKTVQYGDKKPNITAFNYISSYDPTIDMDRLDCEGNITVSTTYEQGSPVSSTGYPVTINASNYTDKSGNYTFTARDGVIYVTKRTVTFTVQDMSIVYGSNFVLNNSTVTVVCDESDLYGTDTVNSVTATGDAPTFTFTSDYSAQTNYGAGTYTVSAHNNFTTSDNYDVEFVDGKLTITKADLTINAKPLTVSYNSEIADSTLASAYTISGAKKNETLAQMMTEGTINVDTTYYKGAPVNAEGYPITIDVSECKFPNYNVTVNNSTITVVKATPVITELPTASLVHNQTLSQAVFTGGTVQDDVAGTFRYNTDIQVVYSSDPYNYPATFIPEDTANYNTVAIPAITLYVSKLPVTGELAITGIAMKGETLTADVSGLDPDEEGVYTFTWKVGETEVGTGTTFTLTEAQVDRIVTLYAVANGYYEGTKTVSTSKVTPQLTSVAQLLDEEVYSEYFNLNGLNGYHSTTTIPYDGIEHIATFTLANSALSKVSVGAVTVKYNGSTTAPRDAGYYNVTIDIGTPEYSTSIEDKDGKTYDAESGKYVYSPYSGYYIGTLYISPKDYTVTLTFNDKVYDGNAVTTATYEEAGACELAGGTKDDVSYDATSATYLFSDANVGTGKTVNVSGAALKGESAGNYNLVIVKAGDGTADITKRTLKASVEPVSREYEKGNYTVYLDFTVDVSSLAKTDSASQVYVDDTNAYGITDSDKAGTRVVTVYDAELAGSKAGNYELELTNAEGLTVEIAKAVPSYPIPQTGTVYYDSARTLSEIDLGYDNWKWDESVRNVIPTAGTHTYKAIFTPNDTDNEATVEYNVKLVVNKATVTIKINSFSNVIYGDAVPTYSYSATGLTGTDTLKKSVDGYIILDSNYSAGSPVGTYAIVRSGEFESDNYSFIYEPGSITVKPRTVYTTAEAVTREYEPGNKNVTVNFSELTNIYPGDSGTVYLSDSTVTGTVATDTAGTKKVSYTTPTLEGDKASNYTLYVYNSNLNVEIAKAVITGLTFPASGTVSYGQKLSTTVFDEPYDTLGLGRFSMEDPSTMPAQVGTFSEGYNVVFTPTDSANYATQTKAIRLTVETAQISGVAVGISGTTQVGKTLYATVGNLPASAADYVTFQWYRVDDANASYREGYMFASGTDSVTLSDSEQGKYIIVVLTQKSGSPYEISGESRTDESIQAETLSFWQRIIKWFYKILSGFTQLFGKM